VSGALLVAPGDPDRPELQAALKSWSPVPAEPLPFKSLLLGSQNDPYCSQERARAFAKAWGAEYIDYGARGHLNAESGLGDWPEGRAFMKRLIADSQPGLSATPHTPTI
jgi:predicted alpha/beta hydrolase family esterase